MSVARATPAEPARLVRHEHLALQLRAELARGRWDVGSRLPTFRVLARQYHASMATVRQAIAELGHQGLVQSRQGVGVFVVALPAERQPRPFRRLAVVLPNPEFFDRVSAGILSVAEPRGIDVTVSMTHYQPDEEIRRVRQALRQGAEALVIAPFRQPAEDDDHWQQLVADLRLPTVLIERVPPDSTSAPISHVTTDVARGTLDAVRHLIGHGARRLALYAPGTRILWPTVLDGFLAALHGAGIPVVPELVVCEEGASAIGFARRCADFGADGIFVTREPSTLELLPALRSVGLRIPDDVAIMEFCDREAATAEVALSGIVQPRFEVGAMAMHLLLRRFETGLDEVCHVSYRPRLVLRHSCGCHD